jgi:hypothetical protein
MPGAAIGVGLRLERHDGRLLGNRIAECTELQGPGLLPVEHGKAGVRGGLGADVTEGKGDKSFNSL